MTDPSLAHNELKCPLMSPTLVLILPLAVQEVSLVSYADDSSPELGETTAPGPLLLFFSLHSHSPLSCFFALKFQVSPPWYVWILTVAFNLS